MALYICVRSEEPVMPEKSKGTISLFFLVSSCKSSNFYLFSEYVFKYYIIYNDLVISQ